MNGGGCDVGFLSVCVCGVCECECVGDCVGEWGEREIGGLNDLFGLRKKE